MSLTIVKANTMIKITMKDILRLASKLLPTQIAYAHCDIPCGIYDPHNAQMAAHTVILMTSMIN